MWWNPLDPGPGLLCGFEETADAREARERYNGKAGESTSVMQVDEKMETLVIPTPAGEARLVTGKKAYVTHDALGRPWSSRERRTAAAIAGATTSAKAAAALAEADGFPGSNNESTVERRKFRRRQSDVALELQTAQVAQAFRMPPFANPIEDRLPRPKPSMMQRGRELYGPFTDLMVGSKAAGGSSSGFDTAPTCCYWSAPPARPPPAARPPRRASTPGGALTLRGVSSLFQGDDAPRASGNGRGGRRPSSVPRRRVSWGGTPSEPSEPRRRLSWGGWHRSRRH